MREKMQPSSSQRPDPALISDAFAREADDIGRLVEVAKSWRMTPVIQTEVAEIVQ
jgi:hypothetical protein